MAFSIMRSWVFPVVALLLYLQLASSTPTHSFSARCSRLAKSLPIKHEHPFTVHTAEYLPAGSIIDLTAEGTNETCRGFWEAPPMPAPICRVILNVVTSNSSEFITEVWLPENWEGRSLTAGNGGLAGCIAYPDLANGVAYSFATTSTNAGHNGTSGGVFNNQPEVFIDFSHRAISSSTRLSKELINFFYSRSVDKSYYIGCSMGGRQGFAAVQQEPDLFDGVIAGLSSNKSNQIGGSI